MSRSPLAYPLTRGIDGDSGGAADLQTDIMRFMAILALCLVAIFALVQSIPLTPETPVETLTASIPEPPALPDPVVKAKPAPLPAPVPASANTPEPVARVAEQVDVPAPAEPQTTSLTRPVWITTFQSREIPVAAAVEAPAQETVQNPVEVPPPQAAPSPPAQEGFTLRFESDMALTRLVASGQVGFYAIDAERAQRMSVSESRISFWDASTPNTFHEMEATTVPRPVIAALARTGADTRAVSWGVTLPGRLSSQLNTLMQQHSGGALVINASGNLNLESS